MVRLLVVLLASIFALAAALAASSVPAHARGRRLWPMSSDWATSRGSGVRRRMRIRTLKLQMVVLFVHRIGRGSRSLATPDKHAHMAASDL